MNAQTICRLYLIILLLTGNAFADTVDQAVSENVARNWICFSANNLRQNWNGTLEPEILEADHLVLKSDTLAFVYQIHPTGYVVVARFSEITPVVAYSTTEHLDIQSTYGFARVLRVDLSRRNEFVVDSILSQETPNISIENKGGISINHSSWNIWSLEPRSFRDSSFSVSSNVVTDVGPLVESVWHQGEPYNNYCPIGDGGQRCVVGCVATATAQVMRFWQWPIAGSGNHAYWWDGDGSAPGQELFADFSDTYEWGNILLDYSGGYNGEQAIAVAELCYEVGVAYEMDYGADGSGAYTSDCQWILPTYFRYSDNIVPESRSDHTAESWFDMIRNEIDISRPLLYTFREPTYGHAIVCDGWRISGGFNQVHMNYGWGGPYNNWYTIDQLYPATWPELDQAYRGIEPEEPLDFVLLTSPAQNELNVVLDASISATFDRDVDESTINDSTMVINAMTTGLHKGAVTYDDISRTAVLDPAVDFASGEIVTTVLTGDIESLDGTPLLDYAWSFIVTAGAASGAFEIAGSYEVGYRPFSVFASDLDSDGDLDLVAAVKDADSVLILLNDGRGFFQEAASYEVGENPGSVLAADFDGDGHNDIAVANGVSDNISVLMNSGNATFPIQHTYNVGDSPFSIYASDLDGDGHIDLVTANAFSDDISVLLNNADGLFAPQHTFAAGDRPHSVIASDFDGDGDLDLATANGDADSISIIWNDGYGSYNDRNFLSSPAGPVSVVAADFDADGDADIACANYESNNVSTFLNNGSGSFAARNTYGAGDGPWSLFTSDVDGDGNMDLLTANRLSDNISVLLNNGDGTFGRQNSYTVVDYPTSVFGADLDGDEDIDLVTANWLSNDISILVNIDLTGAVAGTITDALTMEPIQGVYVEAIGTEVNDLTDENGAYALPDLPIGNYDVFFSHEDYEELTETEVQVEGGQTTILNVSLQPLTNCIYIPGDCDHNGTPLELGDVVTMIGLYRGTGQPQYTCPCPPYGDDFAPGADPNGNCVALELSDVVTEIGAYRGTNEASGCDDCPGSLRILPRDDESQPVVPYPKSKLGGQSQEVIR